eukprot:TRINITY_DN4894_c0_g1_i1.p1 TRINITY_DN4894_c0_g1~~TRINITY_DN4894_c0_g1_i1.p1  ORF type:complete len:257 (+),score=-22.61 TRINITY_DN4894_c0_g1_i1:234-1004(+)
MNVRIKITIKPMGRKQRPRYDHITQATVLIILYITIQYILILILVVNNTYYTHLYNTQENQLGSLNILQTTNTRSDEALPIFAAYYSYVFCLSGETTPIQQKCDRKLRQKYIYYSDTRYISKNHHHIATLNMPHVNQNPYPFDIAPLVRLSQSISNLELTYLLTYLVHSLQPLVITLRKFCKPQLLQLKRKHYEFFQMQILHIHIQCCIIILDLSIKHLYNYSKLHYIFHNYLSKAILELQHYSIRYYNNCTIIKK